MPEIPEEVMRRVDIQVAAYRQARLEIEMRLYLRRIGINPIPPKIATDNYQSNADFYNRWVNDKIPISQIAKENNLSVTVVRKAVLKWQKRLDAMRRIRPRHQ
jgi:hypothetical protein